MTRNFSWEGEQPGEEECDITVTSPPLSPSPPGARGLLAWIVYPELGSWGGEGCWLFFPPPRNFLALMGTTHHPCQQPPPQASQFHPAWCVLCWAASFASSPTGGGYPFPSPPACLSRRGKRGLASGLVPGCRLFAKQDSPAQDPLSQLDGHCGWLLPFSPARLPSGKRSNHPQ